MVDHIRATQDDASVKFTGLSTQIEAQHVNTYVSYKFKIFARTYVENGKRSAPTELDVTPYIGVDTTAPSLTCLENQVVAVDTACSYVVPNYLSQVTAQDNCGVVSVLQNPLPGTTVSTGVTQITITANDGVNQSVCAFTLTVEDQTAPTATAQNITVALDIDGYAEVAINDIDAGSSDNCGAITKSLNTTIFSCDDIGQNEIILTITDQGGLQSTATAIVTVVDTMAPQVVCQDITLVLDENGQVNITPQDIDAGSTDNCGIVSYSIDTTSFDCSSSGQNFVTLTVTDASGNTNSCTTSVTIIDQTAPTLTCLEDQLETVDNSCSFVLPNYVPSLIASDNCNTLTVTQDPLPGTILTAGTTTVTVTASDGSFDTLCSFTIIVTDQTAPTAICQNIILPLDQNGLTSIATTDIDFGSSDNCGSITSSLDSTTFSCNDRKIFLVIIARFFQMLKKMLKNVLLRTYIFFTLHKAILHFLLVFKR